MVSNTGKSPLATQGGSPGSLRDRAAVAVCNFILRRFTSPQYHRTLDALIREGMRAKDQEPQCTCWQGRWHSFHEPTCPLAR